MPIDVVCIYLLSMNGLHKIKSVTFVSFSFGLLGASGCGKTTLLRCILSSLEPDYGEITVLGMEPGIRSSNVPGRDVGYMPQVLK